MSRYVILAAVLGTIGFVHFLAAQEEPTDKERKALPAHYKDLVTPDQRAKIYALQEIYKGKLDALTAQVKALQAERDAAFEALLSPEQKEKLAKARAEAAAKRASATASKKPETEGEKKVETPAVPAVPEKPVAPVAPEKPATPAKKPAAAVK